MFTIADLQTKTYTSVDPREKGNVLVLSFLLAGLIAALSMAHFMVVQKNFRQSNYFNKMAELRLFAQSGIDLAVHQLNSPSEYGDGKIGTEAWHPENDVGGDGMAGTGDEGELDGIPTPGEPNLAPAPVGLASSGIGLLVHTADSAWPDVKRVVSTAFAWEATATLEVYVSIESMTVPGASTVYVQPGAALDLAGQSFSINGNDYNPNGTPGPGPAVYGIATAIGDPPGSNLVALENQVPMKQENLVIGMGGTSSFGEAAGVDFGVLFDAFRNSRPDVVPPGSYSGPDLGSAAKNDYRVSYCPGNISLSGQGCGAGALIVEGSLTLSGTFQFVGVIMVRGDVRLKGGGGDINTYGTLMIGQTLTALDPVSDLGLNGNVKMIYSSEALKKASALLDRKAAVLYWNRIH